MKKIPSLFLRDFENNPRFITLVVNSDAAWVLNNEGTPTRKYDGTCCAIIDGVFLKRYEVRRGAKSPYGFIPADEVDQKSGKQQGWVEIGNGNEDKWHREAYEKLEDKSDGTFELLGPKVQGNPERMETHILKRHSEADVLNGVPLTFDGIKDFLKDLDFEGIVWHHNKDGRMAKIKKKDFRYD